MGSCDGVASPGVVVVATVLNAGASVVGALDGIGIGDGVGNGVGSEVGGDGAGIGVGSEVVRDGVGDGVGALDRM